MTLDLNLRVTRANGEVSSTSALFIHDFASSSELNRERSPWLKYLNDAGRNVLVLDRPGHGSYASHNDSSWAPSQIRHHRHGSGHWSRGFHRTLAAVTFDVGTRHIQHGLVGHLVMKGPDAGDPLAAFEVEAARAFVEKGVKIDDDYTTTIMQIAHAKPTNDLTALFGLIEAIKPEPYKTAPKVPSAPTRLVTGGQDDLATTMPHLRPLLKEDRTSNEVLWLIERNDANTATTHEHRSPP
ncbi:hypothetical protein [Glutamicibacter arilaitensis]|uniref:hypothetical protein n=1 Tax=Glutamicibacter arilaitensis TaxID=256701 RepID=UPI003A8DC0A9